MNVLFFTILLLLAGNSITYIFLFFILRNHIAGSIHRHFLNTIDYGLKQIRKMSTSQM